MLWRRNEFESTSERKWGAPIRRKAPEIFFGRVPPLLALKAQLVVLVSAFVMISTVWLVSCLLFFYSRCPRAQPFVRVGARAPVPLGVGATVRMQSLAIPYIRYTFYGFFS